MQRKDPRARLAVTVFRTVDILEIAVSSQSPYRE